MIRVTLYTRAGCHLCQDAKAVIERVQTAIPFDFQEIDIERDEDLLLRFLVRIPVVAIDGEEMFELDEIEEEALRRRLARVHGE